MKKLLPWTALGVVAAMSAACSGGGNVGSVPAVPTAKPVTNANVAFTVTVPPASSIVANARGLNPRPNFTAPPNTASVSFTVTQVNGAAYTGTPTVANLTGSGCTTASSTVTCTVNVTVPAGDDVILVKTFSQASAGGTATGTGNVQVQTTGGSTVTAPVTLGGTVASIAVTAFAEVGVAGTYPVTIVAKDASGNAIVGAYNVPITLADSDAAHSQLSATTVSDSGAAAAVTLKYDGAQMSPATISASAAGIAAANITNGSFPDSTYPTVNGMTTTVGIDDSWTQTTSGSTPTPVQTSSSTYTNTTTTGQTFGALTNLVEQSYYQSISSNVPGGWADGPLYYAWTPSGNSLNFGFVGWQYSDSSYTESETCSAPYAKVVVLPLPATSWDALAGSGSCVYQDVSTNGYSEKTVYASDGSYTDYWGNNIGTSSENSDNWASKPDGSAILMHNTTSGSYILTIPAPSPNADAISATIQQFPGALPSPGATATPAPVATTAPNYWKLAGIANGQPASPLISDTFTPVGTAQLPSQCNVPASVIGTQPQITEVDETLTVFDPMDDYYDLYESLKYKHFYLTGVGEVCTHGTYHGFWPRNGLLEWFNGTSQQYSTYDDDAWSYVTASQVQTLARTRGMSQALSSAAQGLSGANLARRMSLMGKHHLHR